MITDANRICEKMGYPNRFTLQDRFNKDKSIEIWYLMNYYYNRSYDLKRAAHLWNPEGGEEYYQLINQTYNDIRKTN